LRLGQCWVAVGLGVAAVDGEAAAADVDEDGGRDVKRAG